MISVNCEINMATVKVWVTIWLFNSRWNNFSEKKKTELIVFFFILNEGGELEKKKRQRKVTTSTILQEKNACMGMFHQ